MSSLENPKITDDVMTSEDKEVMERLMLKQEGPEYQYNEENLYEGSRDLRAGGGIMSLTPRQKYGLGSIVKSVSKAVKKVAKSPIGKAALLYAGAAGLGALGAGTGFSGFTSSLLSPATVAKNLAMSGKGFLTGITGGAIQFPGAAVASNAPGAFKLGSLLSGKAGVGAAILGGSSLLTSLFGSKEEAFEAFQRDPEAVKTSLASYYRNINKKATEEEVTEFVNKNIAEFGDVSRSDVVSGYESGYGRAVGANGGRADFAEGGLGNINPFAVYQNYLKEIQDAKATQQYNPLYNPTVSFQTSDSNQESTMPTNDPLNPGISPRAAMDNFMSNVKTGNFNVGNALKGAIFGGIPGGFAAGFASNKGNTFGVDDVNEGSVAADASAGGAAGAAAASNAGSNDGGEGASGTFAYGGRVMRELGGIMNIPMGEPRMNQGGVPELDYRQEGGFVPVGIKEKADDVPAMLSKNEFVMTADAVRGMGNGNIETGAQKMYNLMKSMENRIA